MNGGRPPANFDPVDAGHMIGDGLGGTGGENYNIIPQSAHMNRGAWLKEVEDLAYATTKSYGRTEFTVVPVYDSPTATRPYKIDYKIVS